MGFDKQNTEHSKLESKPIMLLGNGINRIAGRNSDLSWEKVKSEYCTHLPGQEISIDDSFFIKCKELKPTFVHHALASLQQHVDMYLTTNYDYALEKSLGRSRRNDKVIHIHGEADEPEHCIFTNSQYHEACDFIKNLDIGNYKFQSWFDMILNSEVHICGLALESNELLLYHLLNIRKQRILSRADFDIDESVSPIYAWLTYSPDEKEKTLKLAEQLKALCVRPRLIPAYEGNYVAAWERLIGSIMLHFNKIRVWRDDSDKLNPSSSARHITKGYNCSYSSKEDFKYPERCSIKISKRTISQHADKNYWCFYCDLYDNLYLWKISLKTLELLAAQSEEEYIFIYLDYSSGALYFSPKIGDTATLVAECTPIADVKTFDSLISKF